MFQSSTSHCQLHVIFPLLVHCPFLRVCSRLSHCAISFPFPEWYSVNVFRCAKQSVIDCMASITEAYNSPPESPRWKSMNIDFSWVFETRSCSEWSDVECVRRISMPENNRSCSLSDYSLLSDRHCRFYPDTMTAWPGPSQDPRGSQLYNCDMIIHSPGGLIHRSVLDQFLPETYPWQSFNFETWASPTPSSELRRASLHILLRLLGWEIMTYIE